MQLKKQALEDLRRAHGATKVDQPCANQGRPLGGWELVVEINRVPAILREDKVSPLANRYFHLLKLNGKLGQDHLVADYYGKFIVSIMLQGDPKHYWLSLASLLDSFEWASSHPAERWLTVGEHTIKQTLKTQEFHKEVLMRYWLNWVTVFLRHFDAPATLLSIFERKKHDVRDFRSKDQMQALYEYAKEAARINWLSQD